MVAIDSVTIAPNRLAVSGVISSACSRLGEQDEAELAALAEQQAKRRARFARSSGRRGPER